jgi:3',5'-nucleoside bisphosphate phosphatase
VDPEQASLRAHAESARARRQERVVEILERLSRLHVDLDFDDVMAAAGSDVGSLGRPHVARALLARGYVNSVSEAFDRWLADDGPAFVPTALLEPRDAVALIHESGGLAFWAHPAPRLFEQRLERFVASGLDGIECFRPRLGAVDQGRLRRAAESYGLLLSGGSDWHGDWQGRPGDFFVPADQIAPLLERLGL